MGNSSFSAQTLLGTSGITAGTYGNGSNSLQLTVNSNGIITAINTAPFTSINGAQVAGFKNAIINGGMQIWQRGTAASLGSGAVSAYATADRFAFISSSSGGSCGRSTSAPTGFQYSLQLGRTAGSSGAGGLGIAQAIETANSIAFAGKVVTLSFWAKSGTTWSGTTNQLPVILISGTGTDQSAANIFNQTWTGAAFPIATTATLSTAWTQYSFTGTIGTNVTQLGINFNWTTAGTAGADDNVYITGVQLEAGSSATAFENRSFGEELKLCQRYFNKSFLYSTVPAQAIGTNTGETQWDNTRTGTSQTTRTNVRWTIPMRTSPSITFYSPASATTNVRDITAGGDCSSAVASNTNDKGMTVSTVLPASAFVHQGDQLAIHWTASAEL